MKRFFRSFVLTAVAAMGIVACNDVDELIFEQSSGTTLTALAPATTETKVSFTDNDTEGIDLAWENDDSFTLYGANGDYVVDFTCTDADSGTFGSKDNITLNDGESYTAIYPATTVATLDEALAEDLTSTQNGDYISDLNDACMMKATFTYNANGSNSIQFEHLKAIMTFIFTSKHRENGLEELVFKNGDDVYKVTYDYMLETTTSYIMIEPCAGTSRNLYFYLTDFLGSTITHYTVDDVTKEYKAGYRYTADLTTLK